MAVDSWTLAGHNSTIYRYANKRTKRKIVKEKLDQKWEGEHTRQTDETSSMSSRNKAYGIQD